MTAYFFSVHQGESRWWSWIAGISFLIGFTLGSLWLAGGLFSILPVNLLNAISRSISEGEFNYTALLLTFIPVFFGVLITQKIWHLRAITKLMTSAVKFRWSYMWRTILIIFLFYTILGFIEYQFFPQEYEGLQVQTDMVIYAKLLVITLLLVPFQAASEEFLFRGYFNQALIKYLGSPWLVFIITSAGFAALHGWNPEAAGQMGPYLASIFLFGMAMCVLLYFEGGIESAIGAHIANNIFVFGLLGYEDPDLPNTALFTLGEPVIGWTDFAIEFGMTIILIALIIGVNRHWGRDN